MIDIGQTIESALTAAGLRPRVTGSMTHVADVAAPIVRTAIAASTSVPAAKQAVRHTTRQVAARRRTSPATLASSNPARDVARGRSLARTFTNAAGTRAYTLYVPASHDPRSHAALPLVLMLHGCTQDPVDFAAGTHMNALADRFGVLVAYPAQPARDNGSRCWNWFRRQDQARDLGEPSILSGIVAHVATDHRVDPHRVYVAGLSAGAAMAVILGRTYPDVFAAVGAHSGLPFAAAHDVSSAFSAMQGNTPARVADVPRRERRAGTRGVMPTIVFHGNADHTVNQRNGTAIAHDAVASASVAAPLVATRIESTAGGRTYTRESFLDARGHAQVEHWVLHGAGHAWSGGDPAGSHIDARGPDASAEMLRFFLAHARTDPG